MRTITQFNMEHCFENDVGIKSDHSLAAGIYDIVSNSISFPCACDGSDLRNGGGLPLDIMPATKVAQRTGEHNDPDRVDGLEICLAGEYG
jgi:hypothetical protein